ncbi:MAG: SEC-C domain-containing protein [Sulfuricella sp.]|nr:SEC-C domain-containing protein [Sulfuricella sp.]
MHELSEDEANASLENFLSTCVTTLLRLEDPEKFLAWMREYGPSVFPEIFGQIIDPAMRPSAAYSFGRIIWNATPLPGNLFKPRPLPKPERNAPCACGSGMKYKHCCGQTDVPALPLEPALMLNLVLRNLTQKQLADLPYRSISHEGLALTAQQWLEEGKANWAIKLLEPIFADPSKLGEHDEYAFDVLMDAYLHEGKPRKRINLIETMLQSGSRALRVTAMQRHCTMLADAGDYEGAWELFGVAMREYPGQSAFSHLEVTLLMSQGRMAEAKERAKFWVATLRRQNNPDHAELVEFLASIANRPAEAMFDVVAGKNPFLGRMASLVRDLPDPEVHYSVDASGDMGVLVADKKLAKLEADWHRLCPLGKPFSTQLLPPDGMVWQPPIADQWVTFLEKHPLAFQSFDILDDVMQAVWQMEIMTAAIEKPLILPLQDHAVRLFKAVTGRVMVELPWAALPNRPALRVLVDAIWYGIDHGRREAVFPLMEDLVLRFNPDDNHGLRETLAREYLRAGQYEKALALCARYPGDMMADIAFGRVLALFKLNRKGEALTALVEANEHLPEVVPMLVKDNPRQPKSEKFGMRVGGKEQAWHYRQDALALWQGDALEWLRAAGPSLRKKKSER